MLSLQNWWEQNAIVIMELTTAYLMNSLDVEEDLKPYLRVKIYKSGREKSDTSDGRAEDS